MFNLLDQLNRYIVYKYLSNLLTIPVTRLLLDFIETLCTVCNMYLLYVLVADLCIMYQIKNKKKVFYCKN